MKLTNCIKRLIGLADNKLSPSSISSFTWNGICEIH